MFQEPAFNPVVNDENFLNAFRKRTIKLVAPASATEPENLERIRALTHLNIDIPHNITEENFIFHANTDEARLLQLKNAFFDSDSQTIIWTLRGGYGSARLLEELNKFAKPSTEKIFIGNSDITALHLFLSQEWRWKTIHGAGLAKILDPKQDSQNYLRIATIISKKEPTLTLEPLVALNKAALDSQKISGPITGGNLSIIQTSIGTKWQIQTKGKILFIEEVGEKGYRIDRMLNHLKQTGLLLDVKGIVLGQFIDSLSAPRTTVSDEITFALERFSKDIDIPVFQNNQFGHGNTNYPIIYNANSEIILNKNTHHFSWIMHLKGV